MTKQKCFHYIFSLQKVKALGCICSSRFSCMNTEGASPEARCQDVTGHPSCRDTNAPGRQAVYNFSSILALRLKTKIKR